MADIVHFMCFFDFWASPKVLIGCLMMLVKFCACSVADSCFVAFFFHLLEMFWFLGRVYVVTFSYHILDAFDLPVCLSKSF